MALMDWNQSYSVGVLKIDSQHTLLFGILNDLHAAMMKGQAQSLPARYCTSWRTIHKPTSRWKKP
jgi:hypothetical protein